MTKQATPVKFRLEKIDTRRTFFSQKIGKTLDKFRKICYNPYIRRVAFLRKSSCRLLHVFYVAERISAKKRSILWAIVWQKMRKSGFVRNYAFYFYAV